MPKACWHVRLTAGALAFSGDALCGGLLSQHLSLLKLLWGQLALSATVGIRQVRFPCHFWYNVMYYRNYTVREL